jgi:hypothetical protein
LCVPASRYGAYVLTTYLIQAKNCLDEWADGEKTSIPFTQAAYESEFDTHLKTLEKFHKQTKDAKIFLKIQE